MITGARTELIGGHVTPAVKKKLKEAAKDSGKSVSLYLYEKLKAILNVKEPA